MGSSRFRKAIGAAKDQTSITLAKVGSSATLSDLDVAILKATLHRESPAKELHIRAILNLTCYSRHHVSCCISTIARRLSRTKNWVVALKALILIQRLLQDGDPSFEEEIFFATRRGIRLLNMSDFWDTSSSKTWDFSAFVRTYALFLDDQLEYRMQGKRKRKSVFSYEEDGDGESPRAVKTTPLPEMKNTQIFAQTQRSIQLLERFLACRPTGNAKNHKLVMVALYPIVKQSFQIYYEMTEIISVLIDRFAELDLQDSMKVHGFFCRVAKQYDELDSYYAWSKSVNIARNSDYPEVDKISQKKLDSMDEFIKEKLVMGLKLLIEEPEIKKEDEAEPNERSPERSPEPVPECFIKALPAPVQEDDHEKETKKTQDVGDLLNLGDDDPASEEYADKLALALFGGSPATTSPEKCGTPAWEAFKESGDWETALVETASCLSNQKLSLPGGFNTVVLDGMYQQATMVNSGVMGSASSVAFGPAGTPAMLALPAPNSSNGGDPFAASLTVAPPVYIQMLEMEKKQRLMVEEQMMWQQYPYGPYAAGAYNYNYTHLY